MERENLILNDIEEEEMDIILQLIFESINRPSSQIVEDVEHLEKLKVDFKISDKDFDKSQCEIKEKNKHNRCFVCNKKTGLEYFTCKCSINIFCTNHRYPFEHNCRVEYKKEFQAQLRVSNPTIIKDKLERI